MYDSSPVNIVKTLECRDLMPADIRLDASGDHANVSVGLADASTKASLTQATVGNDSIHVEMQIKMPKKEKKKKVVEKVSQGSMLSGVFTSQRFPEPLYFQNVDCVGLPDVLTKKECRQIIDFAEAQGFAKHRRERVLDIFWCDIVDTRFAEGLWKLCGFEWFLRTISLSGMVPCGINDVVRIQKYTQGGMFGRHTDQNIHRADGKVSKYSLRIFLNSPGDQDFDGGSSVFHIPFQQDPIIFEPETGLGLLYPQGDCCTLQEESEVVMGVKYVLRADILFVKSEQ
jgi:hypothetical protein